MATMASSASSSYSGNSFNNLTNGDEPNPQVSWPSPGCPQLKQFTTETFTMVVPIVHSPGFFAGASLACDESCDVAICTSPLALSSDSYLVSYQGSYQQQQQHHVHHKHHEMKRAVAKRVHFWDM